MSERQVASLPSTSCLSFSHPMSHFVRSPPFTDFIVPWIEKTSLFHLNNCDIYICRLGIQGEGPKRREWKEQERTRSWRGGSPLLNFARLDSLAWYRTRTTGGRSRFFCLYLHANFPWPGYLWGQSNLIKATKTFPTLPWSHLPISLSHTSRTHTRR